MREIKDDLPNSKDHDSVAKAYKKFCKERGISYDYLRRKKKQIGEKNETIRKG